MSKANSGSLGYGLSKFNDVIYATVPLCEERSYVQKTFKGIEGARSWIIANIKPEWGIERYELLKNGKLATLRSPDVGVSVRTTRSSSKLKSGDIVSYPQFGVYWYDEQGKPKSKLFSKKRYGNNAELEAHWFAAKQRALNARSELHLPNHWHIESFDLKASTKISKLAFSKLRQSLRNSQ